MIVNARAQHAAVNDNKLPHVPSRVLQKQFARLKGERAWSRFRLYTVSVQVTYRMTIGRILTDMSNDWGFGNEALLKELKDEEAWISKEPQEYDFILVRPEFTLARSKTDSLMFDLEPLTNRDMACLGACFPNLDVLLKIQGTLEVATLSDKTCMGLRWSKGRGKPFFDTQEGFNPYRLLALAVLRRD